MKLTNLIFTGLAALALCLGADAQMFVVPTANNTTVAGFGGNGVYPLLPGGTTVIPALSTNTDVTYVTNGASLVITTNVWNGPKGGNIAANTNLLTVPCSQYPNVGCTFSFTGQALSTNSLSIYASYDNGETFGAIPIYQTPAIVPGAASFITNFNLSVPSVSELAFVITGTGSALTTNALLEVELVSPTYGALPVTH